MNTSTALLATAFLLGGCSHNTPNASGLASGTIAQIGANSTGQGSTNQTQEVNQAPVLQWIGRPAAKEGSTLTVELKASDWNKADALTFSVTPALPYATLVDNGDRTATYTLTPQVGDAGMQEVYISVSDDAAPSLSDTKKTTLAIADASHVLVHGIVRNPMGSPIFGATVGVQATDYSTLSGVDGRFALYLAPGSNQTIGLGKKGYFNTSVQANAASFDLRVSMSPTPHGANTNYDFLDPQSCSGCHPDQVAQWTDTPMAKAGLNTWVHDIFSGEGTAGGMGGFVYTRDSAFAGSNPDSECSSCHQPEVYIKEGFSGRMESPVDAGYPSAGASHGISCEVCHKIADVDVDKINYPGIFPGAVTMDLPAGFDQVMYGAYPDADFEIFGVMQPAYQPQLMAEVCGVCHQDKNDIHEDHTFGGVISEPTYTEWAESDYGDPNSPKFATCVDCHMPATGAPNGSNVITLDRGPGAVRSHEIKGTTPQFLDNAVEMSMQAQRVGDEIQISVDVDNSLTGHHVPTGVTIRNVILVVEAWVDGNDPNTDLLPFTGTQLVHELGGVGDPAQGYYAGRPGKYFGKVNHDANGQGPTFFTDATGITFDSRIPANHVDQSSYSFQVPSSGTGTIQVRARLIYRRSFRFLTDAKAWTQDGHGNPLEDVMAPHYGHLMELASESIAF